MEALFLKLLNMSITAGWLVLAAVVLRVLLKKAPKTICCVLWVLVGVRLIFPFSFESVLSLIPSAETVPQDILYAQEPAIHSGIEVFNQAVNPVISGSLAPAVEQSVNPIQIVVYVASIVWLVGLTAMLLYALISYLHLRKRVAAAMPLRDKLWLCDSVNTPFILGFLRPRIYLPSNIEESQLAHVEAHENAHLKRHDHWWKLLGFILISVYWFNPLVLLAYVLFCRDIELACDECVVKEMGLDDKKAYSQALLSCSVPRRMIAACPLAFGEVGVKERIKTVLNYKKPAFWIIVITVVACIVVAVCFLTNPEEKTLHAPEPFGQVYRADSIVYDAPQYSFTYTAETAPLYTLTADYQLMVSEDILDGEESDVWVPAGGAVEVTLTKDNFDEYFSRNGDDKIGWLDGSSAAEIRRDNQKVWQIIVTDDPNGVFYYILQQKNGDIYLAYGYDDPEGETVPLADDSSIRWLFKLNNLESCIVHTSNGYAEAKCYPDGHFDFEYADLPTVTVYNSDTLTFEVGWDCDTLTVGEDYYEYLATEGLCKRETYTLQKNSDGKFVLDVQRRNDVREETAVYYIMNDEEKHIVKVLFPVANSSVSTVGGIDGPGQVAVSNTNLDACVSDAILAFNAEDHHNGDFSTEAHTVFKTVENGDRTTVYAMALYTEFSYAEDGTLLKEAAGGHMPVAITFERSAAGEYVLVEYWIPQDGAYYGSSILEKFPAELHDWDLLSTQKYILAHMQSCYAQAIAYGKVDTAAHLDKLLETICSSPAESSNPGDYINAHPIEYREMLYYGDYTLRYIFTEFLKGGQTGLKGHIMRIVMEDLIGGEAIELDADNGQEYFDAWKKYVQDIEDDKGREYMMENLPKSYLLLQTMDEAH